MRVLIIVLFLVGGLFSASCKEQTPAPPANTKPLLIQMSSYPATLDPQISFEVESSYVLGNIFNSLVEFDSEFRLSPGLARRWTNPDDHTWRFYLNDQAYFSDGSRLKASDVKFSIERLKSLKHSDLRGFAEHIREINVINNQTIDIKTDTPFSILNNLVFLPILSEQHVKAVGDKIGEKPLGTGPYKLVSREINKKLTLTLNEHYKPKPDIEQVEFVITGNIDRILNEILERKPDITLTLPLRRIEEFQKVKPADLELLRSKGITVEYLIFNLKPSIPGFEKNPLLDINLRKALAHGIDRNEIIHSIFSGFGRPATQLVAPEVFGYDAKVHPPDFNPSEAKRLIREGGYEGLELPIHTLEGGSYRFENSIIRQWNRIGIKASVRTWKDQTEMNEALNSGEFVMSFTGYVCTSGDAGELLTFGLHTRTDPGSYGKGNYGHYSNAEVDRIIQENLRVLDVKTRLEMIQRVMRIVNSEIPNVPILVYDDAYVVSKRIQWTPPVSGELIIRTIRYRSSSS
ncbi:ABC transporter substrate-binding protein [bacterium]|nr:ABC transporter substrate-binding protein [bacterium]